MSEHPSQRHESADREETVQARSAARAPAVERAGLLTTALAPSRAPTAATVGGLATYYRLRCIALEAAVVTLERERRRERQRLDEVRRRYEDILQGREVDGAVTVTRRR